MSFFTMLPDEIKKIIDVYLLKNSEDPTLTSGKFLDDYFKKQANDCYLQYSNNHPLVSKLFKPYFNGPEYFKDSLTKLHNEKMNIIMSNVIVYDYCIEDILLKILNENNKNDIQAQLKAAVITLNRIYGKLIDMCDSSLYYSHVCEGLINVYEKMYFDISVFFTDGANRRMSMIPNLELFSLAKQLKEYNFTYQFPVVETSIFLIRQAVEVHIKNALGIKKIQFIDKNGNPTKKEVGIAKLIDFVSDAIDNNNIAIGINVKILKLINSWTNTYIHTGRYECPFWYIELITSYLNDFFFISRDISPLYKSANINLESSIFTTEDFVFSMHDEISKHIKNVIVTPKMNNGNTMTIITKSEIQTINNFVKQKGLLHQNLKEEEFND